MPKKARWEPFIVVPAARAHRSRPALSPRGDRPPFGESSFGGVFMLSVRPRSLPE